jgi:hypothetical protein
MENTCENWVQGIEGKKPFMPCAYWKIHICALPNGHKGQHAGKHRCKYCGVEWYDLQQDIREKVQAREENQ